MLKHLIFFCLIVSSCFSYQYDLSICTVFRDEAPYLKEWIEYHRLVGVQHFYLCNHLSQDNYEEVLQPYINKAIVELTHVSDPNMDQGMEFFKHAVQEPFYTETIQKAKGLSKWIACIDTDEFLVPVVNDSLVDLLQEFEPFGGLAVNWHLFSTSKVEKILSDELMIEKLFRCSLKEHPWNFHVKSIVQPEKTISFSSPHFANFISGYGQVNTDKIPFEGHFSPYIQVNKLKINHYWCRDEYFLRNFKVPRQKTFGIKADAVIQMNKEFNKYTDFTIYRFISDLKQKMNLN